MNPPASLSRILVPCLLAAAAPTVAAAPVAAASYEVVQVGRAAPLANVLRFLFDDEYRQCVRKARALALPIWPFPALPSRREQRIVTITNGVSSIVST